MPCAPTILFIAGSGRSGTTFLGHILGQIHSIAGNPDRLRAGPVEVRLDDGWKREMMPGDRRLVTALTWPLLARYGYLGG